MLHNNFGALNKNSKELYDEVEIIKTCYRHAKRVLKENEIFVVKKSNYMVDNAYYVVKHIENVIESLNEKERFLLTNEIIKDRGDKWFKDYYSDSTYYRNRNNAYRTFLLELER